jgi:hypothetical protein
VCSSTCHTPKLAGPDPSPLENGWGVKASSKRNQRLSLACSDDSRGKVQNVRRDSSARCSFR